MKFKLFKADGTPDGEKDVSNFPTLEDGKGVDALRQAIIAVHANQRQGNASTKVRSEIRGSGKKIYRQKGLGVGRAGDKKAVQRVAEVFLLVVHAPTIKNLIKKSNALQWSVH